MVLIPHDDKQMMENQHLIQNLKGLGLEKMGNAHIV